MSVTLHLVHREEAFRQGYAKEDFSTYIDFLAAWLGTLGVHDFSYGITGYGEKHPKFKGSI